jgi:hypothetical protein
MKNRLFLRMISILCLAFFLPIVQSPTTATAATECDPAYVTIENTLITVLPTGIDDTPNLQCGFDAALEAGPEAIVHLDSGTYRTAQIVVNDFQGQFEGAGTEDTLVENLPDLYVTPVDMYLSLPSAENPWPVLFAFVNGSFSINNLSIHIVGDTPTTPWTIFGIDPPIQDLAIAVGLLGSEVHAKVDHVLVEGEEDDTSMYGYNLIQAFYFEGWWGSPPWPPISGSFTVTNSTFRRMASGTPVTNVENASVVIKNNTYEDLYWGQEICDVVSSSIEFSHNKVDTVIGVDVYPFALEQNSDSSFLIRNNTFHSNIGIKMEQAFGEGVDCLIWGNNIQNVSGTGIYLGPGVSGCRVVGGSLRANVMDLGLNNILSGVNNIPRRFKY